MNIRGAVDKYDRTTSEHIVAYLDILGTASRLGQNDEEQMLNLNKLHNLYTFATEKTVGHTTVKWLEDTYFKIFSDNIIVVKPLTENHDERAEAIKWFLICISHFQIPAVGDAVGWLVRGGITIGEIFLDDLMVWGSALLRAYEIEDKIANYPRVVVDPVILPELLSYDKTAEYLLNDFDGVWFLNYMLNWSFAGNIVMDGFEKMKRDARNKRGEIPDKIYQKLHWHMNYINSELNKKADRIDDKYRLLM